VNSLIYKYENNLIDQFIVISSNDEPNKRIDLISNIFLILKLK